MKYFTLIKQDKKQFNETVFSYGTFTTEFGLCLVATASKGVVAILFADTKKELLADLKSRFSNVVLREENNEWISSIQKNIEGAVPPNKIPLQLIGTPFQLLVWEALLGVKTGTTCNYASVAEIIGDKNKSRAVASAIGKNPLGYIVPCHRVIRMDGGIGGYRWGIERKQAMLGAEGKKL